MMELCTIDIVDLYPNIPHEEGMASFTRLRDNKTENNVTTETLVELAEIVLKNNIFQFNEINLKLLRSTATSTKFAPLYAVLFVTNLEEKIWKTLNCSHAYSGGILMIYFLSRNIKKII